LERLNKALGLAKGLSPMSQAAHRSNGDFPVLGD
jgi:hypothetical protein